MTIPKIGSLASSIGGIVFTSAATQKESKGFATNNRELPLRSYWQDLEAFTMYDS